MNFICWESYVVEYISYCFVLFLFLLWITFDHSERYHLDACNKNMVILLWWWNRFVKDVCLPNTIQQNTPSTRQQSTRVSQCWERERETQEWKLKKDANCARKNVRECCFLLQSVTTLSVQGKMFVEKKKEKNEETKIVRRV